MRRPLLLACVTLLLGAALAAPAPASGGRDDALPNLFAYPPSWLTGPETGQIWTPNPSDVNPVAIEGCRVEERAAGAVRCLRFMTRLINLGLGQLELALRAEASGLNAYQVTRREDGTPSYRPAGTFTVDPLSGEVRLEDFYVMRLRRFAQGRAVGRPVASTGLRDLCPGHGITAGTGLDCVGSPRSGPEAPESVVALRPLTEVVYTADRSGQYIDISEVRDGTYVLEIEIDPLDHIAESFEPDNTTCVVLRLDGTRAQALRRDYCWIERVPRP